MIPQKFEYTAPDSLKSVLQLLETGAKPLAGGMSLIPMMKLRLATPEHLVDLGKLKELNYIRESGNAVHIGAMSTHFDIETSPVLLRKCPLLAETAADIGDLQVRNRGTIGGSAAHADPSADYPAALQALEARFVLIGADRERTVSGAEFFADAFTTALEPGEIVREVIVPIEEPGTGVAYEKVVQPASGFAIVGIAVRIRRSAGKITFARIGVTGLSNHAYRATAAEAALAGKSGSAADVQSAAALVTQGADANSDLHASADYRKHLAVVHAARAIATALSRSA
ncbi:MAG TPA: xanthine dehydrogenase family protein subunit M [Candidatus Dormibacteraeota bacterium]|nr:xanthine dehydrogenase family protein subunit M [Candidatus Dormibacteraeota bacterium]